MAKNKTKVKAKKAKETNVSEAVTTADSQPDTPPKNPPPSAP